MAPNKAGKMKISPHSGPQLPNNFVPTHDPINPAIIFPKMPAGKSFPVIIPANAPISPPTIHVMFYSSFVHSMCIGGHFLPW